MELARIMAKHRPAATMIFLAVAGEEQGLYGSTYAAQLLANASANVEGMWTNDSKSLGPSLFFFLALHYIPNEANFDTNPPVVGSPIGDDGKNSSRIIRLFAQGVGVDISVSILFLSKPSYQSQTSQLSKIKHFQK